MDIAPDLVQGMNLFRAGKESPSLGHLIGELNAFFSRVAGGS